MPHIFLSYSHEDRYEMLPIRIELSVSGFTVWTDENLTPGTPSWKSAIERAIEAAGAFVVIMTPASKQSEWVEREIEYARTCGVQIFPVLAQGNKRTAVPLELINTQWVDVGTDFIDGMERLIAALKEHLDFTALTSPAVPSPYDSSSAAVIERLWSDLEEAAKRADWEAVIAIGEQVLGLNTNHAEAHTLTVAAYIQRGTTHHEAGRYVEALRDFTRAIELEPNNAELYYLRGYTFDEAATRGHLTGDYVRAITDKNRAIELNPDNAVYYYSRGWSYDEAARRGHPVGDYAKAIADKSRAIELDPNNSQYFYSRGQSYSALQDWESAFRDYRRAADMGHTRAKERLASLE